MFGKKNESWLIVGLGNPGKDYERTRHNAGFRALDLLSAKLGCKVDKGKFQGLYGQTTYAGKKLYLLKPLTFMNASGEAVRAAFREIGDVDVLICNAGICHYGLMSMTEEVVWDRVFAVNVKGIYHCVNAAMGAFLKKQSGCVITVSSMWGQVGASCEAAYSATKGAVIALTRALAKELGPSGIRVNCVAPGVILTDMCANIDKETLQTLAEESALGRNGTPEDVAKAIAYLADAEFVTGQVLGVNGGLVI